MKGKFATSMLVVMSGAHCHIYFHVDMTCVSECLPYH